MTLPRLSPFDQGAILESVNFYEPLNLIQQIGSTDLDAQSKSGEDCAVSDIQVALTIILTEPAVIFSAVPDCLSPGGMGKITFGFLIFGPDEKAIVPGSEERSSLTIVQKQNERESLSQAAFGVVP
eukprot:gene23520-9043_t